MKNYLILLALFGCGQEEREYLKEKRSCLLGKPGKAICVNNLDKQGCDGLGGLHGLEPALGCNLKNSGTCKLEDYEIVFLGAIDEITKEKWCSLNSPIL